MGGWLIADCFLGFQKSTEGSYHTKIVKTVFKKKTTRRKLFCACRDTVHSGTITCNHYKIIFVLSHEHFMKYFCYHPSCKLFLKTILSVPIISSDFEVFSRNCGMNSLISTEVDE